eukprot:g13039.t1
MLHTALMDDAGGGQVENFFFTGADGNVHRKAERALSLKAVEKELRSSATPSMKIVRRSGGHQDLALQTGEHVVAMARTRSGEYLPLTSKALHTIVKAGAIPADFDCLYPFKRAKDYETTAQFANYQHQYVLDDTGGGVSTGVTHRRVAAEVSGRREGQSYGDPAPRGGGTRSRSLLLSKNSRINQEVVATVRSVVVAIERSKLCRVLRLDTEFVLDNDHDLWLVGVTSCKVAARPALASAPQRSGNQQAKEHLGEAERALATELRSRKHEADETSGVLNDDKFSHLLQRVGYQSPTKGRTECGSHRHRRRPLATLNSTIRDATSTDFHARSSGDRTIIPRDGTELRTHGSGSCGPIGSSTVGFDRAAPGSSEGSTKNDPIKDTEGGPGGAPSRSPSSLPSGPVEMFDSSVPKLDQAATNLIYGSTQVEGCRGDFCDFDVGKRVREEETRRTFVEKAARAAGAANGLVENLSPLRLKILSMDNKDVGDATSPVAAAVVRPGGRGPQIARHSDRTSERFEIPYKSVVQARQERPLAEAFLRRYARGENGEYHHYLDGGEGDEPYMVGGKYPGVYYRPVKVCSNCHMVYTLVDEARARALRKVRRGIGGGGGRQYISPRVSVKQSEHCDEEDAERQSTVTKQLLSTTSKGDGEDGNERRDGPATGENKRPVFSSCSDGYEHSAQALSLAEARKAMDVISQGDISELRSFVRPPAAVSHVASVAMILLEGKSNGKVSDAASVSWVVARAAMGRGDFVSRLRSLDPRTLSHQQLCAVVPALERSCLDPAIVRPLSNAAGNLCLWILGAIQASRWLAGSGHTRTNTVPAADDIRRWGYTQLRKKRGAPGCASAGVQPEPPFPHQQSRTGERLTPERLRWASPSYAPTTRKRGRVDNFESRAAPRGNRRGGPASLDRDAATGFGVLGPATASPTLAGRASDFSFAVSEERGCAEEARGMPAASSPCRRRRDVGGRVAAQAFASGRLANPGQSALPEVSSGKSFACSDGRTCLPYRVCGDPGASSGAAISCNFVVVHDFFDNVDKTEVLFRPVTRKHRGCRVLAFSYPGQAGTVFSVPKSMAGGGAPSRYNISGSDVANTRGTASLAGGGDSGSSSGGKDALRDVPNNAFIAPRLHELLQHVHSVGEMSLAAPFHLVGIGNGMATAAAFALRYGDHPLYRSSLRSIVSINGFSSVDSQLAAVLHSSLNAFATLPPARPDLPVSFLSRYVFSEEYLSKVGRNLALGIYTAVANPVTLEGRHLLFSSALLHQDLSGEVGALGVPMVLLQSTEDVLVNPANVDPFLRGRGSTHHFWSHEFRNGGGSVRSGTVGDGEASSATTAVIGSSVYGRKGRTDLLRALSKPRGTFVAWVRAGHEVCQEGKRAVLDLLDLLAKPTPEHAGVDEADVRQGEAEGSVALGIYPSGEWVARVNKREGDLAAGKGGAAGAAPRRKADDNNSEDSDAVVMVDHGRRENRAQSGRDSGDLGGDQGMESGAMTAVASPFPRDISIPTLPPNIGGRHRTPNTSPIKRSHGTTSRAAAGLGSGVHHTAGGFNSSDNHRQSKNVDAFGLTDDDDSGEPRGERHGRREGRRRSGRVSDAQDYDFRAARAALAEGVDGGLGRRGRPKVVWKDATPSASVAGEQEMKTSKPGGEEKYGEENERGSKHLNDYSTSYFPAAALVYHDSNWIPSPTDDTAAHAKRVPQCSSTSPCAVGSRSEPVVLSDEGVEDPWDLVKNSPSLGFPPSDPLQRGNRRWVVNKRTPAAAGATVGVGKEAKSGTSPGSPVSSSSPPTAAATAGSNSSPASSGGGRAAPNSLGDLIEAEASLQGRLCEARRRAAERLVREEADVERRIAGITEEQRARSRAFAQDDREMIAELEKQLEAERLARAPADLQRAVDGLDVDDAILREGLITPPPPRARSPGGQNRASGSSGGGEGTGKASRSSSSPVRAMPPLDYSPLDDLPEELRRATDAYSVMDDAARDEAEMLRLRRAGGGGSGALSLEQFQRDQAAAASEAAAWRLTTKKAFRKRSKSELERARVEAVLRFQPLVRGVLARKRARRLRYERDEEQRLSGAAVRVQTVVRGRLARHRARAVREDKIAELVLGGSALRLQRVGRGMLGRRRAARRRREVDAVEIQRCYRGHLGRRSAARQRALLEQLRQRNRSAVKVQAWWRCKSAVEMYARARTTSIAAVEIQRCYRGVIGRKKAARRLAWQRAEPGPERLKLGVRLIEDSKTAFEAQRMEIAALHTAGERAVVRTSRIRRELDTSEKELTTLEREMNEIDHIEGELSQLNHQRNMVQQGLMKPGETMTGVDTPAPSVSAVGGTEGGGWGGRGGGDQALRDAADKEIGFALEMQIQIKRAEREKKRQELEADFRGVRQEVELKRRELERVVAAIGEIEFTRERKSAEFRRMQSNLMELLREQKLELDSVKEKGIQLEVATATSAAAASATAQRAKDHEERSSAMFSQTEELMKFQFMSMSLSYFSSLNMLKTMRDINADTTTAAVTSSADAAAAAAASAAAANIPSIKAGKVLESVSDAVGQEIGLKNKILQEKIEAQEEMEEANAHPFPREVRFWTKEDVGHFLTTLGLRQYRDAFAEAAVDGDFLLALDQNDCADVLGVEHALHSKKLFLAIDKLRPLTVADRQKKAAVEREDSADAVRGDGPPTVETVFSQVRNGRVRRLADSLDKGFPVDTEDEHGNTALMVACQNVNTELCELLLRRGADVNHRNGRGNTPLHYAMAYDPQGVLGELLISRGGDDTIANQDGLSCYDGLGGGSSSA